MQTTLHYFLHLAFPLIIAFAFFKKDWKKAYFILLATMLIDIDHLLANPIFEPHRCSIGVHPLHSPYVIPIYIALLFFKKPYRIIGVGLLFHLFTDFIDCLLTFHECNNCLVGHSLFSLLNTIADIFGN